MNRLKNLIAILFVALLATSCFDDRTILFTDTQIEFENAVTLARATGQNFPIINLTRASGTPAYQVNLIGAQLAQASDVSFSVDEVPASLLNATTIAAVEGTHYTLNGNKFTFPVSASTTNFTGLTINSGFPAQAGVSALLIIKLDGNDDIKPSENYRRLAFKISLN